MKQRKQGIKLVTLTMLMMVFCLFAASSKAHGATSMDLVKDPGKIAIGHDLQGSCTETEVIQSQKKNAKSFGASALSVAEPYASSDKFGSELTGFAKSIYTLLQKAEFRRSNFNFTDSKTGEKIVLEGNYMTISYRLQNGETLNDLKQTCSKYYASALFGYLRDYPEKFLWSNGRIGYGTGLDSEDSSKVYITFVYAISPFYNDTLDSNVEQKVQSIVSACNEKTVYTKLKYYHDWLVEHNDYDEDGTGLEDDGSETWYYAHSAVGCLLRGKGVCESYAKAFKLFCDAEHIPCMLITSETHMWNYVRIEGKGWYMIDATYDDPINGNGISDTYFLVSNDPAVDRAHTLDDMFFYPRTEGSKYVLDHDYYVSARKKSTCVEAGHVVYTCTLHGDTRTEALPVDLSNHIGARVLKNESVATTSQNGYTGDTCCSSCGRILIRGSLIPRTMSISSCINTASGIQLRWKKAEDVDGYYIYRKSGSAAFKKIVTVDNPSVLTYTDKGVKSKNGSTYTYAVRAYADDQVGSYVSKKALRLTGVTLTALKNSTKKAMKANWKKNSKATGYQLQYSTSSSFAKGNKTVTVKKAASLTKTIKGLKKGKKYYARIRVYKKSGSQTFYSAWSSKKSVKIKK